MSRLSARGRWVAAAVGLFGLALALRGALEWIGSFPGDRWARHHLDSVHAPAWASDVGFFFASIGTPVISALTVAAAGWFVWRAAGPRALAFTLLAFCGVLVNMVLKRLSGPTPTWTQEVSELGLNYPSGHTVYAVVFFGALAWVAWRRQRLDIAVVLVLLIVAMGPTRVLIETHFVSDVIAGYLVGAAWLITAALLTGWVGGGGHAAAEAAGAAAGAQRTEPNTPPP